MRHLSFKGVFPILQTPFNEKREISFEGVRKETEWLIEQGVDGIGTVSYTHLTLPTKRIV